MMEGRGALKTVLCFGDSNTFGYDPIGVAAGERARYPFEERWPGAMQRLLGSGWRVVEEGLSGRTTVHDDPFEPGLCGMDALVCALGSAQPLDCVIIMLGTNDMKTCFGLPASDIARGAESLVLAVKRFPWAPGCHRPKIVIVSPPHIGEGIRDVVLSSFDMRSVAVSHEVAGAYRVIASEQGCAFLDASEICEPSPVDHIHLSPEGHGALARPCRPRRLHCGAIGQRSRQASIRGAPRSSARRGRGGAPLLLRADRPESRRLRGAAP